MQLLRAHFEKPLLALAVLALGMSLLWVRREQMLARRVQVEPVEPRLSGTVYAPEPVSVAEAPRVIWAKPVPVVANEDWSHDLFTPPDITYDAATRSFETARSAGRLANREPGAPFSLQLLAVKQEAYRLQLAGYFGRPDDYLAAFVSSQTTETLLARAGHRFAALGLTLKSFDVCTVLLTENEAGPVYEAAALAVLHDEQTNREVVLDSRQPLFTDNLLAVFRLPGEAGAARDLREGDSFAMADAVYRIERIQLEPAEVVLSRTAPGLPAPELRVLRPEAQAATRSRPSGGDPVPTTRHLAARRD